MTTTHTYKNFTWIDVASPTADEIRTLIEKWHINPEIGRDLALPSPKSHIEYYTGLIYLVLHFPVRKHSHRDSIIQEVDFLIGKKFVMTVRYGAFDPLEEFSKYAEVSKLLHKDALPHAGLFFFEILKHIYDSVRDDVASVADELEDIEPRIFSEPEKELVRHLSILNRALLGFREALSVQRDLLEVFSVYGKDLFGKDFDSASHVLMTEHKRALSDVEHIRDTVRELRETNNTLLSTKQNEVMKNIAMVSFVTFPLSLIVAIFGLRASLADGSSGEFWLVLFILVVATVFMFMYFKKKQWL